jgi:glycosyltransferase involved in cell wall biosynthesis
MEIAATTPVLSVVVPFYNEEDGLDVLFERLENTLEEITGSYEILCVDDGSCDNTLSMLIAHRSRNPKIKIISLTRNFGKDIALSAGLDHTTGQAVVPFDADLQDPPEVIIEMFNKWREGKYDVVYGKRSVREGDSFFKRLSAKSFYRIHNLLAFIDIPKDTGDFRLMDRRVVEALRNMPEQNRFMKGMFSWVGFRQVAVEYVRAKRAAGTSRWKYWQLWNFALDGITSSSTLPLRIWTYFGMMISLASFAFAFFLVVRTLVMGIDVPGYASMMVVLLFLGGINILATGILGEYIGRIFNEVRRRPLYLIREHHGLNRNT